MRRTWLRTLVPVGSTLALVVSTAVMSVPSSADTTAEETDGAAIVIDPDETLQPISRDLFGFNSSAFFLPVTAPQDQGPYDAVNDEFNPKIVQAVKETQPASIRYPGGTIANYFNWKNAIGQQEQRQCWWIPFFTAPASSAYGPDEHMRFVEAVGADANLVVNSNSMTPQDAADWVEYMNTAPGANPNGGKDWAQERADNGHLEPYGVTWWEVGNELAGNPSWLRGVPQADRAEKYAFGGTSSFTNQRVGTGCTRRPKDSRGDGTANQQVTVYYPPVEPDSLSLTVDGTAWTETDDLSAAGPNDQVYALDTSTGEIVFGDGEHGAIPPDAGEIRVSYTSGPHAGFVDFYDAMKAVDPSIEVCWGTNHMDYGVLGDNPVDCVQDHVYSKNRPPNTLSGVEDWHDAMMHRGDVRGVEVARHQAVLNETHPDAGIAATEYGFYHLLPGRSDADPTPGYLHSLDQGLYIASNLLDFIDAGVPLAQNHQLYNYKPGNEPPGAREGRFNSFTAFGYHPTYLTQAPGHVMELFSHMVGIEQVATDVLNGPVRHPANADLTPYPALRTGASTDEEGRLTLMVVNRDPQRDVTAEVLPKRYLYRDTAKVWTLDGDSIGATNTPDNPEAVGLTKQTHEVDEGGFDHTFPAHSVTAIQLTDAAEVPASAEVDMAPSVIPAGADGTVEATATISNPGDRVMAGELSTLGPAGWTIESAADSYRLAPGKTRRVPLTIAVPPDTADGDYQVGVVARQRGQVADVASATVTVMPGSTWPPLFSDTFDDDPVGQPPSGWDVPDQPPEAFLVQPGSDDGNVLVVQRSQVGHSHVDALRPFETAAGDVRLSYRTKADQPITGGFALWLQDASGDRVSTVSMSRDVFVYTNGNDPVRSSASWEPGTWYRVDVILNASAGTYDVYVDGVQIADDASSAPGAGPPAAVKARIGANQSDVSSFALDDMSVAAPESGS